MKALGDDFNRDFITENLLKKKKLNDSDRQFIKTWQRKARYLSNENVI